VEDDGGRKQKIETSLNQPRVGDEDLYAFLKPPLIPSLAFGGIDIRAHDRAGNSLFPQDALQPRSNIPLLRIHREDLAPSALGQFFLDFRDQPTFFCIDKLLGQILGFRDQKPLPVAIFIELKAIQLPQSIGTVWIKQQGIQHDAQDGPVAAVRLQCLAHGLFKPLVSCRQRGVHEYFND
jgi:hypothetical protein